MAIATYPKGISQSDLEALEKRIIERVEKEAGALAFAMNLRFDKLEETLENGRKRE